MEMHEVVTTNSTAYVLFVQYTLDTMRPHDTMWSQRPSSDALLKVIPMYSHACSANSNNVNRFASLVCGFR